MTDSIAAHAAATNTRAPASRIFLTGGSGYVGRNLIRHFVARGHIVTALVRSSPSAEIVRTLGAAPCMGALFDTGLADAMAGCDTLIHAAADTGHGPATKTQRHINVDGTRMVLEAARAAGIRKVIHLSTESVLATGRPLVDVDETMPLPAKPAGCYSSSKAEAERIALAADGPDFSVIVLRPRFVWGRDDTTALPMLMDAVRSGKFAWIAGGNYLTSTTHVANLCHAVELALVRGRGGEVYFISDGEPETFRNTVSALVETQGVETQGVEIPAKTVPRFVVKTAALVGDAMAWLSGGRIVPPLTLQAYATSAVEVTLNIGKARRDLGYQPVISRQQGLAELRSAQHR